MEASSQSKHSGDFIRLLTAHQPLLRGLIASMLPGNQDVDDILQDANVIMWEQRKKYNWGLDFKPWACGIARNIVRQYWSKNKRHACVTVDEEFLEVVAQARQDDTSDGLRRKKDALSRCMSHLKPREKDLMEACYSAQESIESRVSRFGLTSASLRVTTHRIRKKLRLCIEKRLVWEGDVR